MKKNILILLIFLVGFSKNSYSCQCDFFDFRFSYQFSDFIAKVKITETDSYFLYFDIIDLFKGKETHRINVGDGCEFTEAKKGEIWVLFGFKSQISKKELLVTDKCIGNIRFDLLDIASLPNETRLVFKLLEHTKEIKEIDFKKTYLTPFYFKTNLDSLSQKLKSFESKEFFDLYNIRTNKNKKIISLKNIFKSSSDATNNYLIQTLHKIQKLEKYNEFNKKKLDVYVIVMYTPKLINKETGVPYLVIL